jgi:hypothetical protein
MPRLSLSTEPCGPPLGWASVPQCHLNLEWPAGAQTAASTRSPRPASLLRIVLLLLLLLLRLRFALAIALTDVLVSPGADQWLRRDG